MYNPAMTIAMIYATDLLASVPVKSILVIIAAIALLGLVLLADHSISIAKNILAEAEEDVSFEDVEAYQLAAKNAHIKKYSEESKMYTFASTKNLDNNAHHYTFDFTAPPAPLPPQPPVTKKTCDIDNDYSSSIPSSRLQNKQVREKKTTRTEFESLNLSMRWYQVQKEQEERERKERLRMKRPSAEQLYWRQQNWLIKDRELQRERLRLENRYVDLLEDEVRLTDEKAELIQKEKLKQTPKEKSCDYVLVCSELERNLAQKDSLMKKYERLFSKPLPIPVTKKTRAQ